MSLDLFVAADERQHDHVDEGDDDDDDVDVFYVYYIPKMSMSLQRINYIIAWHSCIHSFPYSGQLGSRPYLKAFLIFLKSPPHQCGKVII